MENREGDPRDPRIRIGLGNENADFHFFLRQILYHAKEGEELSKMPENHVIEILRDNRILVVIDNFEDISRDADTLKQFKEFFGSIDPASKSRINHHWQGGKQQSVPVAMSLNLKEFDTSRIRNPISVKAFKELVRSNDLGEKDFRYSADAIEYLTNNPVHVPEFIRELERNVDPNFVKELGKPYNILEYTRIIGEKSYEMRGETSQPDQFRDKVMFVAARDAQLRQFITQRRLKSAEDAYNDLLRDENCKEVLLVLWQSGAVAINELEIRSKITERNNIQPLSSNEC